MKLDNTKINNAFNDVVERALVDYLRDDPQAAKIVKDEILDACRGHKGAKAWVKANPLLVGARALLALEAKQ